MNAENALSVLAAGYVSLDIINYRGHFWHMAGGTAANVAAISSFMGKNAAVASDLGNDQAGREIRRDLMRTNVCVDFIRLNENAESPRLVHEIDEIGHRYKYKCPTCCRRFAPSRPLRMARAKEIVDMGLVPKVLFVDRLNAGTIILAEHFADVGSLVVFEPSRPANGELTERMLKVADVIKFADDRDSGLCDFEARRGQVWIVTRGQEGAMYRIGNGKWYGSPAFYYPTIDAGGAGDWTTAGLIHALETHGRRTLAVVGEALRWAQALAAISCGAPGARGLARQQSVDAVMRTVNYLMQEREEGDVIGEVDESHSPVTFPKSCSMCLQPFGAKSME